MAEYVVTIGSDPGDDYATFSDAEDDIPNILTAAGFTTDLESTGDKIAFEFRGETHVIPATVNINASLTTGLNGHIILRPMAGAAHQGEWKRPGCAVIEWAGTTTYCISDQEWGTRFEDLCFELPVNNGQLQVNGIASRVTRCMFKRTNDTTGAALLQNNVQSTDPHEPMIVQDSTFVLDSNEFVRAIRLTDIDFKFNNCTFHRASTSSPGMAFLRASKRTCLGEFNNNLISFDGRGTLGFSNQNGEVYSITGAGNVDTDSSSALDDALCIDNTHAWSFTTDDTAAFVEEQVVWQTETLKLYDVAGTDAWRRLSDATNASAVDIAGNVRGATFNPGAYESAASAVIPDPIGSADLTTGAASVAAAGGMIISGQSAGVLGSAELAAQGQEPAAPGEATGTLNLGAATAAAAGGSVNEASGTFSAGAVAVSGLGGSVNEADGPLVAGAAAASGLGSVLQGGGLASLTTGSASLAAGGAQSIEGASTADLPTAQGTASGSMVVSGSASLIAGAAALSSANTAVVDGVLSAELGPGQVTGQAETQFLATSAPATGGASATGSGGLTISGAADLTLAASRITARTDVPVTGYAPLQLFWTGSAEGSQTITGSGALRFTSLEFSASSALLNPHRAYVSTRTPRLSMSASGRLASGPALSIATAPAAQLTAQGGMVDLPNHSPGAGIIIS